jgi:hypothetical protein
MVVNVKRRRADSSRKYAEVQTSHRHVIQDCKLRGADRDAATEPTFAEKKGQLRNSKKHLPLQHPSSVDGNGF